MRSRSARLDMSMMHDRRSTSAANAVTQSQLQIVLRQTPIASATACWLCPSASASAAFVRFEDQ